MIVCNGINDTAIQAYLIGTASDPSCRSLELPTRGYRNVSLRSVKTDWLTKADFLKTGERHL
ncbi:MAG: hypothetical protein QM758_28440 [Armatimonas sp.]